MIAPTLAPMKASGRVKTDRRDAERLARSYRFGDLMAVWVPDECSEAQRDLVWAWEAAKPGSPRTGLRLWGDRGWVSTLYRIISNFSQGQLQTGQRSCSSSFSEV
jgi:hypothetical protein